MLYIRQAFENALDDLTKQIASKTLTGSGAQKDFNVIKSKAMETLRDNIKKLAVSEDSTTWAEDFSAAMNEEIRTAIAAVKRAAEQLRALEENDGVTFDDADFIDFTKSVQFVFGRMGDLFGHRLFAQHKAQDGATYVDTDPNKAPWFNQFVHLSVTYYSKKLVFNVVNKKQPTNTEQQKQKALFSTLGQWTKQHAASLLEESPISPDDVLVSAKAYLTALQKKDTELQTHSTGGLFSQAARGFAFYTGISTGTLYGLLDEFVKRFDAEVAVLRQTLTTS